MSFGATLTAKQRRLIQELQSLYDLIQLDYYDIKRYPPNQRTVRLEVMRRAVVRQEIITAYTRVDEYLSCEICVHFFGARRSFIQLWRTKKFTLFNACFLEEMSLMPKLRYVKSLKVVPRGIASDIERLNALRNAMAHSFFPENVRRSRALWKGQSVFTPLGIESFCRDIFAITQFFARLRNNRY